MKRLLRTSLLAGALAAALAAAPAAAAPTFGNNDLKGEFLFTVVEVHTIILPGGTIPVAEHCVIAGAAVFDGVGTMSLSGRQRCSRTGTGDLSGTQYYAVNPDGSVLISESADMSDPVHGQLVEHGRTLLLDGTTRTLPEIQSWSGIAMRR
jgi:hypothetical protein